jgi:hypothetical protein
MKELILIHICNSKNGQNRFSLKLLVLCYFFTKIGCTLRVANTRIRGDLILKNCNKSKLKVTESQTKFPKNQKDFLNFYYLQKAGTKGSSISITFKQIRTKCYLNEIKQGVCHTVALPFTLLKGYLKAKEELWKLKYFTMQKYNLPKIL